MTTSVATLSVLEVCRSPLVEMLLLIYDQVSLPTLRSRWIWPRWMLEVWLAHDLFRTCMHCLGPRQTTSNSLQMSQVPSGRVMFWYS